MMLVMIMYGVTPLMSAAITKTEVTESVAVAVQYDQLLPVEAQRGNVSAAFAYLAYAHQYLGGPLPPFTSEHAAVLPVKSVGGDKTRSKAEDVWVAESTVFEGSLNCTAGIVERVRDETRVSTPDGSCEFMLAGWRGAEGVEELSPYTSFLVDGKSAVGGGEGAATYDANCTMDDFFVAGWAQNRLPEPTAGLRARPDYTRAAAVFCRPVHKQYEARVRLKAESRQIVPGGIRQLTDKMPFVGLEMDYWLGLLAGSNISAATAAFNVSDSLALLPDHMSRLRQNPAFHTRMEQYPSNIVAENTSHSAPPINVFQAAPQSLMGFGLSTQSDLEALFNTTTLAAMYDRTYRKLFAFAVTSELARAGGPPGTVEKQMRARGIVANAAWCRALEAALGVILVLNVVLAKRVQRRRFELAGDPGTLASALACVDSRVLEVFTDAEFMRPRRLETELKRRELRYVLRDQKVSIAAATLRDSQRTDNDGLDRSRVTLTKPWELCLALGCMAMTLLLCGVAILCVVFAYNLDNYPQGFREPTDGFAYALYSSYVPTIAATSLESYLVLLGAQVALLYPFKQLQHGNATHAKSLSVNYDRAPPHLQLLNAFRARNLLLGGVSLSILLANILAVAVGGIFDLEVVRYSQRNNVTMRGAIETLDAFDGSSLAVGVDMEPFYAAFADTLGSSQPPCPWTFDGSFFIPFTDDDPITHDDSYWVESLGLGVEVTCRPLSDGLLQRWHGRADGLEDRTYEVITLREKNDTSLVYRRNDPSGPSDHGQLFDETFFTAHESYTQLAPTAYPRGLGSSGGPLSFFTSWIEYRVEERNVTVDLGDRAGAVVSGASAYIASKSVIHCDPSPRIVRGQVQSGVSGNISSARVESAGDLPTTGLSSLLAAFHASLLRLSAEGAVDVRDGRARDWVGLLVERAAGAGFDAYSNATASARALESVYGALFTGFLRQHADAIFSDALPTVATRLRHETRVVMHSPAVAIALGIVALVVAPAIVATYITLYRAFLCHAPTNLAGVYAAVYASRARLDVKDTERQSPALRAKTLDLLAYRYRYGWFVGKDGQRHFGVEREPLCTYKPRIVRTPLLDGGGG